MSGVEIVIPGEPMAQPRPRATVVGGHAHVYQPKAAATWKGAARDAMVLALDRAGLPMPLIPEGPVHLTVHFRFTMPKSRHLKREPRRGDWHTKRPDLDNCVKAIKDAAENILWLNDSQVCWCLAEKQVADQGEAPCIRLWVEGAPSLAEAVEELGAKA